MFHGNNKGLNFSTELVAQVSMSRLKDFATGRVDGILHLPDGQVNLFWINIFEKSQNTEELKGIKLLLIFISNNSITTICVQP